MLISVGIIMNEHIEYFKRFSASYMRWTHFNFDRIVADAVRRDAEAEAKRKEELRATIIMAGIHKYTPDNSFVFDFDRDIQWGILKLDPKQVLNLQG